MRAAALLLAAVVLGACAADDGGGGRLTVFAAASLTGVFTELDPEARFNFAGSDELATQLREGARADVYAAASPRYPRELHDEGVVERPRVFATNRLVLVVPADNPARIRSVRDLARPVKLVVGAPGVPVGDYARSALRNLRLTAALANVVSNEEDVKGVVAKVAAGEADAGFVYATDVETAADDVRAIELPSRAQTSIAYPAAIVAETRRRDAAADFVDRLFTPEGRRALRAAGFGVP